VKWSLLTTTPPRLPMSGPSIGGLGEAPALGRYSGHETLAPSFRQAPPIDADQLDAFGFGDIPYRPVAHADALTQTPVDLPDVRQ
jgi:hypothetical protein